MLRYTTITYMLSLPPDEKDVAIELLSSHTYDLEGYRAIEQRRGVSIERICEIDKALKAYQSGPSEIPAQWQAKVLKVLAAFTHLTGVKYKCPSRNASIVHARIAEDGYEPDYLIAIAHYKHQQWRDTDFLKYVRPETLFAKQKIERYANEYFVSNVQAKRDRISDLAEQVERAKRSV